MKISVSLGKSKTNKELVKKAVRFYAAQLFSDDPDRIETLEIEIVFENLGKRYAEVSCDDIGENYPDFFSMTVNETLRENDILVSLAHEMVHVHQYATRRLTENSRYPIWRGKPFKETKEYIELPWEIEAFWKEESLAHLFKTQQKKEKKIWLETTPL